MTRIKLQILYETFLKNILLHRIHTNMIYLLIIISVFSQAPYIACLNITLLYSFFLNDTFSGGS